MPIVTDETKINAVLTRSVDEVLPSKAQLKEMMLSGKKLRLYTGIDPTSPSIHLGNAIILRKMQEFVELGHQVIYLIGTFTGQVGDPSDKDSTRTMLSEAETKENMKEYKKIANKVLDFDKVELVSNGDWLSKMTLAKWMHVLSKVTLQQLIERDLFQRRIKQGKEIWMHEFMYPILQGYDSVRLNVDLELGGTDQTFNMLMGRKLQKAYGKRDKFILSVPLIPGTDGQKMSKSAGNTVNLDDCPTDMYGKIMSMCDEIIPLYFECCTDVSLDKVKEIRRSLNKGEINPMELKKELAKKIVEMYHGPEPSAAAEKEFETVVQKGEQPEEMKELEILRSGDREITLLDLVIQTGVESKSEAKRLIKQRCVRLDNELKENPNEAIRLVDGMCIKIGKRNFYRINV